MKYNENDLKSRSDSGRKTLILILAALALSFVLLLSTIALSSWKANSASASAGNRLAMSNKQAAQPVDISESLRKKTVDYVLDKEYIPAYSYNQVQSMDMSEASGVTVEDLKLVTRHNLVGLEDKLWQMEQDYELNCLFLLGIASHESAYGTSQFHPNNICGYGYSGFNSKEECLDTVGRVLAKNYLSPNGPYYKGTTIDSVNKTYAADPAWDSKVANKVAYFYKIISQNHNKQLEKLK